MARLNPATLQIDEGKPGPVLPFRTCLAAGCLIDLNYDAKQLPLLGKGTALKVNATADGGKETAFSVSLEGFESAWQRAAELAK